MNFNDKNVIIFGMSIYPNTNQIVPMGSLYDSIEYFLKIYEENKDIQLLFHLMIRNDGQTNVYKRFNNRFDSLYDQIRDIIRGKYYIDDWSFMDNIHFIDLKDLFFNNIPNKILTIDLITPKYFKDFIARAKNGIYIIPELTSQEFFYKSKINKVTYYTEMPFCYGDINYRLKFDFERCKPIKEFNDKLYINYPKQDPFKNTKILVELNKLKKDFLIKEDQFLYDLHKHFNEYVYFQSDLWFDTHPRLFHECKYYNKPYHYFNWKGVKDGGYYRYKYSLEDDLKDLQLTKDDIIVKEMS